MMTVHVARITIDDKAKKENISFNQDDEQILLTTRIMVMKRVVYMENLASALENARLSNIIEVDTES